MRRKSKITFWYTIRTNHNIGWDTERQHAIQFANWHQFAKFCRETATANQAKVRGCQTMGYSNSGSYFEPEKNMAKMAS